MISLLGVAPPYFLQTGPGGLRMQQQQEEEEEELFIMRREREREATLTLESVTALSAVTITDRTSVINHRTALHWAGLHRPDSQIC